MQRIDTRREPLARRMDAVQSPIIPVVGEWIRENPGTISLGQGVVHYPPPIRAVEAVVEAMREPERHRYGHVSGIPPLLARLRTKLARENEIEPDGRAVVVTAGGNIAFVHTLLAIADAGDEVVLMTPYYFNHEMAVAMAGCKAVLVPTDDDFQLRVAAIERAITSRTRAVVTVSPNNPTGAVYEESSLRAVNEFCRRYGVYHVHDEAYEYFTYDRAAHFSPASASGSLQHTISLFSFSKAYGMAAWRMGYMSVPEGLLPALKKIQDTTLICPPVPSQYAALQALEAGPAYCRPFIADLAGVRDLVYDRLRGLDDRLTVAPARGAFYCFVRARTEMDDLTLVRRLIEEHRVAVIPGSTFGMTQGCYLRIAYGALERDAVDEAMGRLASGLQALV